jgi:MIP family channel proteins
MLFCFIGCGVAVSFQAFASGPEATLDNSFILGVSMAFGLAITVLAYTVAPISGAHLNPAVSLAFVLLGELNWMQFVQYTAAQMLGAIVGVALVWMTYKTDGDTPPFLLASNAVHSQYSHFSAFLGESLGTFILVWTVLMTAVNTKSIAGNVAPIAVGWSVMLAHLLLIPITGCGINPARSFGSHFVTLCAGSSAGEYGWWIFYTAPFVGSALATAFSVYNFEGWKNGNCGGQQSST